jgi:hypothetical protein
MIIEFLRSEVSERAIDFHIVSEQYIDNFILLIIINCV